MKTLVTGGAGFIGSHLVDALVARGDDVVVVDDLSTGRRENVNAAARLVEATITDAAALDAAFASARPALVFHLAAQVDVRRSVADPAYDLTVNVGGTVRVLEAARGAGTRQVVMAATGGAVYGAADLIPTPEIAPAMPLSPYGQAKLSAEGYCRVLGDLWDLAVTSLRFANVYGPRQDPLGEGGVAAIFCAAAVAGRPVTVFGDGEQTRDFVYVDDVVTACLAAGAGAPFGPFNIGTGKETSVNALARSLGLAPQYVPERPGEVRRSCLDPRSALAELGWKPATSLTEGLAATMAWARTIEP